MESKMKRLILVDYTPALIKKAALRSVTAYTKYWAWFFILIGVIGLILAGISGRIFYLFLGLESLVVCPLIYGIVYFRVYRASNKTLKKLQGKPIRLSFEDKLIIIDSEIGHSELKWHAFEKLLQFKDVWHLFNSNFTYIILPIEKLSPELQQFIVEKLQQNNVKIK